MVKEKVVYEEKLIKLFQSNNDDIDIIALANAIIDCCENSSLGKWKPEYDSLFFRIFASKNTADKLKSEYKGDRLFDVNLFIDDSLDLGVCKLIYDNNFDINVDMEFGLLNPISYSYYRKVAI